MFRAMFYMLHAVTAGMPSAQANACPSVAAVVERLTRGPGDEPTVTPEFELAVSRAATPVAEGLRELRGRYVRVVYRVGPGQGMVRDGYLGWSAPGGTLFLSSWSQAEGYGLPSDAVPLAPESIQSITATGRPDSWDDVGRAAMVPPAPRPEWPVSPGSRGAPSIGSSPAEWFTYYARPSQADAVDIRFRARMRGWAETGELPLEPRRVTFGQPVPERSALEVGRTLAPFGRPFWEEMGRAMLAAESDLRAGRVHSINELLGRLAVARRDVALATGERDAANFGMARQPDDPVSDHRILIRSPAEAAGLLREARLPFQRLLEGREDGRNGRVYTREALIEMAAQLHWLLAQASPYRRGSSEIADATVRTLLRLQGVELRRWTSGFSPGVDAFRLSRSRFVAEYVRNSS